MTLHTHDCFPFVPFLSWASCNWPCSPFLRDKSIITQLVPFLQTSPSLCKFRSHLFIGVVDSPMSPTFVTLSTRVMQSVIFTVHLLYHRLYSPWGQWLSGNQSSYCILRLWQFNIYQWRICWLSSDWEVVQMGNPSLQTFGKSACPPHTLSTASLFYLVKILTWVRRKIRFWYLEYQKLFLDI